MAAKYPGLGSKRWIPFFDKPPTRGEGENETTFERRQALFEALRDAAIEVVFLGRDAVNAFDNRWHTILAEEKARQTRSESPLELTLQGQEDLEAFHLDVIRTFVVGVRGIEVGAVELATIRDPGLIATLLQTCDLHYDASLIARRAQRPTNALLDSRGSS